MEDRDAQIRLATAADAESIVKFNLAMAWETEQRRLDGELARSGVQAVFDLPSRGFYLVAEIGQQVVGALLITFEWSDWRNGDFWWLQSVYVDPAFRRRGIFKALFRRALNLARERSDVCGLRLYVEHENLVAQDVYRQLGMHPTRYRMFEISRDDW